MACLRNSGTTTGSTDESRWRRVAIALALLICACFALWKMMNVSLSNGDSNLLRHHYLMLQDEWSKTMHDIDERRSLLRGGLLESE